LAQQSTISKGIWRINGRHFRKRVVGDLSICKTSKEIRVMICLSRDDTMTLTQRRVKSSPDTSKKLLPQREP
jgi:hypothetical protein